MQKYKKEFYKKMKIKDKYSDHELKLFSKAQKYSKLIRFIPWLKMVAICNSLSMRAWNKNSDIDLFIVTDNKRMWFVRILITFIFQILWVRRHWNKVAWRLCLSFFVTNKWMNFNKFVIENDIYLYYWIFFLKPIIIKDNTYNKFLSINKDIMPDNPESNNLEFLIYEQKESTKKNKKKSILDILKKLSSILLDKINYILKNIFLKRALNKKKRLEVNKDNKNIFWIIINKNILKFHNNDKRVKIRNEIIGFVQDV